MLGILGEGIFVTGKLVGANWGKRVCAGMRICGVEADFVL